MADGVEQPPPAEPTASDAAVVSDGEAPTEAPPATGTEDEPTNLYHNRKSLPDAVVVNKQPDFYICIGLVGLIAIVCAIGVLVIHFIILSEDGKLMSKDYHEGTIEGDSSGTTAAPVTGPSTSAVTTATTAAPAPP